MSLITIPSPVGMDLYIQALQTKLHDELVVKWALLDTTKYHAYGRCYRNKKDAGYVAEVFKDNKEYDDVYWNDKVFAVSFFGISGPIKRSVKSEVQIHFVMFANLSELSLRNTNGETITHRGDEELRQQVTGIIGRFSNGFRLDSTEFGIENVLREYPGSYRDKGLKNVDMHPVHCFRLNLNLIYDHNKIC
jgi:hypothetical protein